MKDTRTIDDILAEEDERQERPGTSSDLNRDLLRLSEQLLDGEPAQRTLAHQPRNLGLRPE